MLFWTIVTYKFMWFLDPKKKYYTDYVCNNILCWSNSSLYKYLQVNNTIVGDCCLSYVRPVLWIARRLPTDILTMLYIDKFYTGNLASFTKVQLIYVNYIYAFSVEVPTQTELWWRQMFFVSLFCTSLEFIILESWTLKVR